MKTTATVLVTLALLCTSPAFAQHNGRGQQKCAPGDPHCRQPMARNDKAHRADMLRRAPPPRPHMMEREPDRYDDVRHNDRYVTPTYRRGDRMDRDHRSKQYVVDDWRGHGLRRPPIGYHWVQNGSDYLLVAITTGIILELMLNH